MKLFKDIFSEPAVIPEVLNQKRYPGLNGLRGISIILVVIYHFIFFKYPGQLSGLQFIGPLGVEIFFVISGFLITSLCLKEKIQTGNISLKAFYIRRILRIIPVAYLYIIVIFILNAVFHLQIAPVRFMFAALFLINLSISRIQSYDWYLAHYWSLSTEEQFYLFFPAILKKYFRVFVFLLLIICFVVPIIRFSQSFGYLNYSWFMALIRYLIKFQSISIGCLISILTFKGHLDFKQFKLAVTLLAIAGICYFKYNQVLSPPVIFCNLATAILIGLVVVNCIRADRSFIFNILNSKLLSTIGILSYSIYIWQQPFLSNDKNLPLSMFPYNFIFLLITPVVSYYCFEKYFLKLKQSFHKRLN
ncbi:acyltransferase family protein [Mucilaginibacter panaciglaebae]|uniref:acyltransferase family protein n=1 Tax=Mucilaginibacter panaciglaebae TaxID=502331 RepID=UPI003CD07DE4